MATTRAQKEKILEELTQGFADAKSVVFVDLHGLTVEQSTEVRRTLRNKDVKTKVAKKTLISLAGKKQGYDLSKEHLQGQIAVAFSLQDELAAASQLFKLSKKFEKIKFVGGIFEKKVIDQALIQTLAQLPSKEELLAKLVGSLKSPLSKLHTVLSGPIRGFVQILKQVSEKGA